MQYIIQYSLERTVHPQNVQLLNVQLQNVQLQYVQLQGVQLQDVQITKRPVYQTSSNRMSSYKTYRQSS